MTYQELNKMLQECTTNVEEPYNTMILEMVNDLVNKETPTEQEVCEALSEWRGKKVSYDSKEKVFTHYDGIYNWVTQKYYDNRYTINPYLPPHLITLIGRFYEGVKENE